jgi:hypothetical protein
MAIGFERRRGGQPKPVRPIGDEQVARRSGCSALLSERHGHPWPVVAAGSCGGCRKNHSEFWCIDWPWDATIRTGRQEVRPTVRRLGIAPEFTQLLPLWTAPGLDDTSWLL